MGAKENVNVTKRERVVDPRAEELRNDKFFPKKNYAMIIQYFAPSIPLKRIYCVFNGDTISEARLVEVLEAAAAVVKARKAYEREKAEALVQEAKKMQEEAL